MSQTFCGNYTITSLVQNLGDTKLATGVTDGGDPNPISINQPDTTWTITPVSDNEGGSQGYYLSVGSYGYTGISQKSEDPMTVIATNDGSQQVVWCITSVIYNTEQAYTIQPSGEPNNGWTLPIQSSWYPIVIRPIIPLSGGQYFPSQLFNIRQVFPVLKEA